MVKAEAVLHVPFPAFSQFELLLLQFRRSQLKPGSAKLCLPFLSLITRVTKEELMMQIKRKSLKKLKEEITLIRMVNFSQRPQHQFLQAANPALQSIPR